MCELIWGSCGHVRKKKGVFGKVKDGGPDAFSASSTTPPYGEIELRTMVVYVITGA
jgi:hypothetical protein